MEMAESPSQLSCCIEQLQACIAWDKSIMKVYCQVRQYDINFYLFFIYSVDVICLIVFTITLYYGTRNNVRSLHLTRAHFYN